MRATRCSRVIIDPRSTRKSAKRLFMQHQLGMRAACVKFATLAKHAT
jgi:hypothetical protein